MTTRKKLEETLAAQRARRSKILPPIRPLRKNGGGLAGTLMILVILAASGIAMSFAVRVTNPRMNVTTTTFSSMSLLTSTPIPATPVAMQICTHIPNGRLHVRFAAGDSSEVRGYLAEGETVQLTPATDSKTLQGELWLPISYPIAGWVNARFVCTQEK